MPEEEREPGAEDAVPPPLLEAEGECDPPTAPVEVAFFQTLVEGECVAIMLLLGLLLTEALGESERVPLALAEVEGDTLALGLLLGEMETSPLRDTVPQVLGLEVAYAIVAVAAPRGLPVGRAGDAVA